MLITNDTCVSTKPYFEIPDKHLAKFLEYCDKFIEKTANEPKCLHYIFSFDGNRGHCQECYVDADGVLAHLDNIDKLNRQAMHLATIFRYEVHGPQSELDKLKEPLAFLNPDYYVTRCGFRHMPDLNE
jgi:quinol monooxygenase YgiN